MVSPGKEFATLQIEQKKLGLPDQCKHLGLRRCVRLFGRVFLSTCERDTPFDSVLHLGQQPQ
jgi:hypothetical protein